jgi:hydroxymethylglutaryl-CoA lyase
MAGAAEVAAAVLPELSGGQTAWALVPNARGAELATSAGVDHLTITVSASEAYSAKNVHMTLAESLAGLDAIRAAAPDAVLDLVVSFAFGSSFDGEEITPDDVTAIVDRARAAGCDRVTLADTTGVATPRRVEAVLDTVGTDTGLHLHDTRATALLNAWTAIERGIVRFDTAVGGLGGSPFAPAAGGNLATEDLVHLLDDAGIDTGVDLGALLALGPRLADLVGHGIPSRVAAALAP